MSEIKCKRLNGVCELNIYDIAKEAGVSIATVSRVLNGKPNVSPKTCKRVQDVLRKNSYTPNDVARGLASRSTRLIGIVMEDIRNTHYSHTAYTVEQELSRAGYHSLLCNTGPYQQRQRCFQLLAGKQLDGLVLVGSVFMQEEISQLLMRYYPDTPVVMVNGSMDLPNLYAVVCDDRFGIELCVEHLAKKGHRNIAYLHALETPSAEIKEEGFRVGMFKSALPVRDEWVLRSDNSFADGERAARRVADMQGVSAVICGEDMIALGLLTGLMDLGREIPGDYAVTGYNNSFFTKLSKRKLTSVDNKLGIMGTEAARILCNVLQGREVAREVVIRPELFVGNST